MSHFYHPTPPPPPRNPNGFWRGVDDVLEMQEGTRKAADLIFMGHYEAPRDSWETAGFMIGAPIALSSLAEAGVERLGSAAIETLYQGSQQLGKGLVQASRLMNRWGLFGKQAATESGFTELSARRAYLNAKFGRVGDLHTDITLRGYLNQAEKLDVSTSPNTAVFYSGDRNRAMAEEFSRVSNRTILEMTPGGRYLDNQHINMILPKELSIKPWIKLSERYAQSASGETYAFIRGSRAESIFNTIELPALLKNPNVTDIFERETPYLYETTRINYAP